MLRKIGVVVGVLIAAVILIIVLGPLFIKTLSEEQLRQMGMIEADSKYADVGGVKTRYIAEGGGENGIVCIHGFSSSLYTWRSCIKAISEQYRVYALDLAGFGFSEKPDIEYTIDEYVDFVTHFMDSVGLQKATLCGNSMGGNIAWRAALKYPERVDKLILVDAGGYVSKHTGIPFFLRLGRLPGVGELFGAFITRGQIRDSLVSAYHNEEMVTERTVDAYYYPMRTEGAMRAVLARLRSPTEETEAWQGRISSLELPTLIVWGDSDTWIPPENAERFHRDIPGSMLVMISDCGHLPQEERPGEFVAAVLSFMSNRSADAILTNSSRSSRGKLPAGVVHSAKVVTR